MLFISDSITMLTDMKTNQSIQNLEARIAHLKRQLQAQGPMRPGSLSLQYNVCGKPGCRCKDPKHPRRHGPYYQLSWVHQGQSTTQFIRRPYLPEVKAQLATFKKFRRLSDQWVTLSLRLAKLRLQQSHSKAS